MKKSMLFRKIGMLVFLVLSTTTILFAQKNSSIKVGAFYFDGWTGKTPHINASLMKFTEREPVGGWKTSSLQGLQTQIDQAADAGIDFFNFCWYYNGDAGKEFTSDLKNSALNYYLQSPNNNRLGFSLMIVNNDRYSIKAEDWQKVCEYWCSLFKKPTYLKVDNKPLISFFTIQPLVDQFKDNAGVKRAMDEFRAIAKKNGFPNILIGISMNPSSKNEATANDCGFDALTGYNFHGEGLAHIKKPVVDISEMPNGDNNAWNSFMRESTLPIIPTITLNWDKRPSESPNKYSRRFSGYSGTSVKNSILNCRKWIANNPNRTLPGNIVFVYAWNEYAEGAWLTPSKAMGSTLLDGLKAGLSAEKNN